MRRALIHAIVGPIAANILMVAIAFTTSVLADPAGIGDQVVRALKLVPALLTMAQLAVFAIWALLAWIGMLIADARETRTVFGVVRLAIGAVLIGGPGLLAFMTYGTRPVVAVLAWTAICAGSLAACRSVSRWAGAERLQANVASLGQASVAPIPEHRAVFGRRGLI